MVDQVEQLAIDRAKQLFGAEHANVQPHSGSQANMAAYFALAAAGRHAPRDEPQLRRAPHARLAGELLRQALQDRPLRPAPGRRDHRHGRGPRASPASTSPKILVVGASAYPRTLHFDRFAEIAREVGAALVVDMAHIAGLVAAGLHPTPVPHAEIVTTTTHKTLRGPRGGLILSREAHAKVAQLADLPGHPGRAARARHRGEGGRVPARRSSRSSRSTSAASSRTRRRSPRGSSSAGLRLVSGGTDNHLMLVDLRPKKLTGKIAEEALGKAGITVNKNMIPLDPEKPMTTSGIRVGTPALTTRGMGTREMAMVAALIGRVLDAPADEAVARERCAARCGSSARSSRCTRTGSRPAGAAGPRSAMRCPFCGHLEDRVVDSREAQEGQATRRRRECLGCARRFTTYERIEEILPQVVKKDGRREPFDRKKIVEGVARACQKRPVSAEQIEALVAGVERAGAGARRARDPHRGDRRGGDAAAAAARRGGLRPLRLGVPRVPRRRRVHDASSRGSAAGPGEAAGEREGAR